MTKTPISSADVAAACGVSRSTVVLAYRHPDKVIEATRKRIHEAGARLGYVAGKRGGPRPGKKGPRIQHAAVERHDRQEEYMHGLSRSVGQACDRWLAGRGLPCRSWQNRKAWESAGAKG